MTERIVNRRSTIAESVDFDSASAKGVVHTGNAVAIGVDRRQRLAGDVVDSGGTLAERIDARDDSPRRVMRPLVAVLISAIKLGRPPKRRPPIFP